LASPLNVAAHSIYAHYGGLLRRFETASRLPEEQPITPGDAEVAIFGMGRVGVEAYDTIRARYGDIIIGVDADPYVVERQRQAGRQVIHGDAADPDFWERAEPGQVNVVMLTIPSHAENLAVAKVLRETGYDGHVAATARYTDEVAALEAAGADAAYDIYREAGTGFAQHVAEQLRV
ncbi:MAG: NAD(P)-binding protein, partial [Acidiferrobacterales bacterium]